LNPEQRQLPLGLDSGASLGLPDYVEPMRIQPVSEPFDSPDYLFETRWRGIRTIASISAGNVRLHNRRQGSLTERFPELELLSRAAAEQPLMLDGDVIVLDHRGRPDFDALQHRLRLVDAGLIREESLRQPACFLAYDVLFRDRRWLLSEPLSRRKRALAEVLHPSDCIYLSEPFDGEGHALYQAALDSELEGIVAKPKNGPYSPGGFGGQWLMVGCGHEDFAIGGYSMQIAAGERVVELLAGGYDAAGQFTFVTAVPPPSDEKLRNEIFAVLNALQIEESPFAKPPPFIACWVRPELVVSISFSRREGESEVRYPMFERVRLDVAPDECLLAVDGPVFSAGAGEEVAKPRLTMLTTMPLPLGSEAGKPAPSRPHLRVVGAEES
jgi:ATP-dependent DNA ligase